jgi:GxxExxY protein
MILEDTTNKVIQAFYKVYNTLGYGFLEKVYENAFMIELIKMGFICEKQKPITVYYEGQRVGDYYADIVINNSLILELKAAEGIIEEHECQLINYLKATEIEIGLLFNFGKKTEFKRKIFTNDRKKWNTNDTDRTDLKG